MPHSPIDLAYLKYCAETADFQDKWGRVDLQDFVELYEDVFLPMGSVKVDADASAFIHQQPYVVKASISAHSRPTVAPVDLNEEAALMRWMGQTTQFLMAEYGIPPKDRRQLLGILEHAQALRLMSRCGLKLHYRPPFPAEPPSIWTQLLFDQTWVRLTWYVQRRNVQH